mgnify:FL=1
MKLDALSAFADVHGLLDKRKIVPRHLSPSSWTRAVTLGQLVTVQPGVAVVRTSDRPELQQIAAALLASGDDAVAAGPTSAWLQGVSIPLLTPLHVITPTRPRHRTVIGTMLHRPTATEDLDVQESHGLRVTGSFRTVLDTAAWAPAFTSTVFEKFLVDQKLSVTSAWRNLFQHARQGRPGISVMRTMLQKWALDTEQPESVLEAKMLSLCFIGSLPPFEFQAELGPYRVDFLWREQRVIAECDGFAYHGSTRERFEYDRQRDAYLQSLGYTVWRFSFRQILNEPQLIASQLRTTFRREFD